MHTVHVHMLFRQLLDCRGRLHVQAHAGAAYIHIVMQFDQR